VSKATNLKKKEFGFFMDRPRILNLFTGSLEV